jgi:hypothetical protein
VNCTIGLSAHSSNRRSNISLGSGSTRPTTSRASLADQSALCACRSAYIHTGFYSLRFSLSMQGDGELLAGQALASSSLPKSIAEDICSDTWPIDYIPIFTTASQDPDPNFVLSFQTRLSFPCKFGGASHHDPSAALMCISPTACLG